MLKKVEVDSNDIFRAWEHWCEFSKNRGQKLSEDAFFDFLDPVRQSDLRRDVIIIGHEEDVTGVLSHEGMEVSEQVERRIALLAGPHFHAVLMASLAENF